MDITPIIPKGKQIITGYGNGGFKINDEFVQGSLIVFPQQTLAWDGVLTLASLEPILNAIDIELLLFGSGQTIALLGADIRQAFKAKHIAIEVMNTGAACRTYNVLMSEERRVAAALIAV